MDYSKARRQTGTWLLFFHTKSAVISKLLSLFFFACLAALRETEVRRFFNFISTELTNVPGVRALQFFAHVFVREIPTTFPVF
jgi:succinate dehydrogenase hydrophobic anchor subunit